MGLAINRAVAVDETASDAELVALALDGSEPAVRVLVQHHNRQLFRVARGVMRDNAEAEDVVQEAYVRAFTALAGFRGEASFATWLTRIALNEALGRQRRRRPTADLSEIENYNGASQERVIMFPMSTSTAGPESEADRGHVRRVLERAVDELPDAYRMVFVLRDVEGLSTEETAERLSIQPGTAKTRLHRARRLLRRAIERTLAPQFSELFPFGGQRCGAMVDRVVDRVFEATRRSR